MKALCLLALAAGLAIAQTKPVTQTPTQTAGDAHVQVFVTARGKTYHTYRDCIGLQRSKSVLEANEAQAQQHGLTLCGICAHRHHAVVGKSNAAWAKAEGDGKK